MIKILNPYEIPGIKSTSKIRALIEEALEALEKNPHMVVLVTRDDGKFLVTTAAKQYLPKEGVRMFQRGKQIFLKKEKTA